MPDCWKLTSQMWLVVCFLFLTRCSLHLLNSCRSTVATGIVSPACDSFSCHFKILVHCNRLSNLLTADWTWNPSSLLNIKWPFLPTPNFQKMLHWSKAQRQSLLSLFQSKQLKVGIKYEYIKLYQLVKCGVLLGLGCTFQFQSDWLRENSRAGTLKKKEENRWMNEL